MLSEHTPSRPLAPAPTPFNMAAYVLRHAGDMGKKTALAVVAADGNDTLWTYAQLARAVEGVATGLLAQGVTPGDRVLMRLGNTVDFPLAYLAAIHAGLVPVPTSSQLTEVEISKMAAMVAPKLIIASEGIALPVPQPATAPCPVLTAKALHEMADLRPRLPIWATRTAPPISSSPLALLDKRAP